MSNNCRNNENERGMKGKIAKMVRIMVLMAIVGVFCLPQAKGVPQAEEAYRELIAKKISSFLVYLYPQEAKEKKWEGIVRLKFPIKKDGNIGEVKVEESSGYPLLDMAARWAVESASPYPFPFTDKEVIDMELSVKLSPSMEEQVLRQGEQQEEEHLPYFSSTPQKYTQADLIAEARALLKEEKEKMLLEGEGKRREKKERAALKRISIPAKRKRKGIISGLKLDNVYSESLPSELKEFIAIAIENCQPLLIAKEEMNLAKIKRREAARNLLPALKIEAYETTGVGVAQEEYEEREVKATLDQPLYSGGRLWNAHNQAKVNLEITKRNYDQKILDTIHKAEVAYYTLITLRMNLEKHNEILKEAEKILEVTERQYKKGVIIPLQLSNVKSWCERLRLLKDTIVQELDLAYLTFQQVLDTEASPTVNLFSLEIKEFDISLSSCIKEALESRPEINLAKLAVRFQEYNKKMEDAKNSFNIDLTGSYGAYEGHFLTEDWESAENWYVGVKVTKAFGGSTSTTSVSSEESQPRYGQSAGTESETISTELSIFDNLKMVSERKEAKIALLKAQNELEETQKNITFEVQDSFFKHKKSLLELKSALAQKSFREEEFKINQIKIYRGEGDYPSLIQTLLNLSDAENTYLRALGNYYISLATLRKATGYGLRI